MDAIIVLNYNDAHTVKRFMEYIESYIRNYHVIIVDNCSTDNSFEELQKLYGSVCDVIKTERNGGYAYGNNFGIKYAKMKYNSKYCVVSNPDVLVDEKVLEKSIRFLKENLNVAVVSGKMIHLDGTTGTYCWKLPDYKFELLSSLLILNRLFVRNKNLYSTKDLNTPVMEVEVIAGSLMIMNVASVMGVGGFDEETFLYCEEQIIGSKLKNVNLKMCVLNDLEYVHNHSASINKTYKDVLSKYKLHQKSKMVYLKKCLKIGKVKQSIFGIVTKIGIMERVIGAAFIKKGL